MYLKSTMTKQKQKQKQKQKHAEVPERSKG